MRRNLPWNVRGSIITPSAQKRKHFGLLAPSLCCRSQEEAANATVTRSTSPRVAPSPDAEGLRRTPVDYLVLLAPAAPDPCARAAPLISNAARYLKIK